MERKINEITWMIYAAFLNAEKREKEKRHSHRKIRIRTSGCFSTSSVVTERWYFSHIIDFYYMPWQNRHMIKGIFTTAMTGPWTYKSVVSTLKPWSKVQKAQTHIWREVPFTQHKERGRRKRTAEEDSDTNDTTFQSKWHKVATSWFKKNSTENTAAFVQRSPLFYSSRRVIRLKLHG